MTQLDIYFPSVKTTCYSVNSVRVSLFTEMIISAPQADLQGAEWFFNNDEVLTVTMQNGSARIIPTSAGSSTIKFVVENKIVGTFDITVEPDQAATLGLKASDPILK